MIKQPSSELRAVALSYLVEPDAARKAAGVRALAQAPTRNWQNNTPRRCCAVRSIWQHVVPLGSAKRSWRCWSDNRVLFGRFLGEVDIGIEMRDGVGYGDGEA